MGDCTRFLKNTPYITVYLVILLTYPVTNGSLNTTSSFILDSYKDEDGFSNSFDLDDENSVFKEIIENRKITNSVSGCDRGNNAIPDITDLGDNNGIVETVEVAGYNILINFSLDGFICTQLRK